MLIEELHILLFLHLTKNCKFNKPFSLFQKLNSKSVMSLSNLQILKFLLYYIRAGRIIREEFRLPVRDRVTEVEEYSRIERKALVLISPLRARLYETKGKVIAIKITCEL